MAHVAWHFFNAVMENEQFVCRLILRLLVITTNLNILTQLLRNIFVLLTIIVIDHIVEYLSCSSINSFWMLLRLQSVDFIDLVF